MGLEAEGLHREGPQVHCTVEVMPCTLDHMSLKYVCVYKEENSPYNKLF